MSRRIIINKYEGNTHWNIHVIDSFGQEHHLGSTDTKDFQHLEDEAVKIWSNETKKELSSLSKAIKECIEIDKKAGITSRNRDGLD